MRNIHFYNFLWIIAPLVAADIVLKAVAMWKSARNNQLYWFISFFVLNTLGILPAIYLLFFQKKKGKAK